MSPSALQVKHINQYREKTAPYPLELLFAHFTTTAIWSTRSTPSTPRVRVFPANVSDLLTHLDICKGLDTQRYIYATSPRNHPPGCARLCNFTVSRSCDPGIYSYRYRSGATDTWTCNNWKGNMLSQTLTMTGWFLMLLISWDLHRSSTEMSCSWEALGTRLSNSTEQRQPHNGWEKYRNSKLQWV